MKLFGMTIIEATVAGLPVVASDLGGSRDIIGDRAGWLVQKGDVGAWVSVLRGLKVGDVVDHAGAESRSRWQANYRLEVALTALEEICAAASARRVGR